MKVAVGMILLGAFLAESAYASDTSVAPSLSKAYPVSTVPSAKTHNKPMKSKKVETSDKVGAVVADPEAKKPDNVTETPPESTDESVQLKGVRG